MNLLNIIDEELSSTEEIYILDEGLFSVSPAIAMFAFKDNVLGKIKSTAEKISHPVSSAIGAVATAGEKMKAKTTGQSGNKDNDTVYKLTKEQKEVMAYIYKKYGPVMVNKIQDFRTNILPPYNIIKRNLAKNKSLSNKEIFGMTKEDYYKYRESGRKKIEKKGTYFKDAKDLNSKQIEAREALEEARKKLEDFKSGKLIDLTATNIEKIFDEAGIGRKKLNGWTDSELEKTSTEIIKVMNLLKNPKKELNGLIRTAGRSNTSNDARYQSRESLELRLKNLQEKGVSYADNKKTDDGNHHGSFKDAFAIYMTRREVIKQIRDNSLSSDYKKFYEKVLKDAINAAQKIYDEKFENYASLKGTIELNQYEKKIWKLKSLGTEYSGDINDWYLNIKPEDFIETKYYGKSDKVIAAEKEMDKILKQFERDLKKEMSEEDVALCKRYRLFNNLLTVKEFRDSKNMFKGVPSTKKISTERQGSDEDFSSRLNSALNKEYNSIKDLEDEQKEIKSLASGKKMSQQDERKYNEFINRINPKKGSSSTKIDRSKITSVINNILYKEYTGKTEAASDLKELEDTINDYIEVNGKEDYKQFEYDVSKARGKINAFIEGGK